MQIKLLTTENIDEVCLLHLKTLADLSSVFGLPFLKNFYSLLISQRGVHLCFGAFTKGEIIGAVTVTKNMHQTHVFLNGLITAQTFIMILRALFSGRVTPGRLIKRLLFEYKLKHLLPESHIGIITFCVKKEYQRQGIGSALFRKVLKQLNLKFNKLYVDTRVENTVSLTFYKAMGFKVLYTLYDAVILMYQQNPAKSDLAGLVL